jgi:glucose-6-phosphate 1-epimerase
MSRSDRILSVTNTASQIDDLNRRFGIAGVVQVAPGNSGLPKLCVSTTAASAEIYLHGAQVTSWRPMGAGEVIFLSELSHWRAGLAIRGGIPICFPWFRNKADDPKAPSHGFVRIREWRLHSVTANDDGVVIVTCSTESDESTRRWWPYEFRLEHRVTVAEALRLELIVHNTGPSQFSFEEALHTYFRVGDARNVRVQGLDQVTYLDNADANRERVQKDDVVFNQTTDNAYLNTQSACDLIDPALNRTIRTAKQDSATTVVWNPWLQGAALLTDLGDEEWQRMTCVEASNIRVAAVTLAPGEQHIMRAVISVL